jgi:hypothetical protein
MDPKTLFAILGLLIVLCLLCTCLGTIRELDVDIPELGLDSDETAATPPWGKSLSTKLQRRLSVEDVSDARPSGCREQLEQKVFVLAPEDTCTLTFGSSFEPVRTLPLRLTEGGFAEVVVDPNEDDRLTARQTLGGGRREFEVQVFKEGGTVVIQCLGESVDDCRLRVE